MDEKKSQRIWENCVFMINGNPKLSFEFGSIFCKCSTIRQQYTPIEKKYAPNYRITINVYFINIALNMIKELWKKMWNKSVHIVGVEQRDGYLRWLEFSVQWLSEQKEFNEVLESSINNTNNQLINEKEEWDDSNKIAIKFREYEDILHSTTLLANRHYRDTNNFVNVFGENLRTFFFNMITMDDFRAEIENIRRSLPLNYSLPEIDMLELIEISKITTTKNATHIQIDVEIPIFYKENYTLFELIPTPISNENTTSILNFNSLLYFLDNDYLQILPFTIYDGCIKLDNLTICNTIVQNSIEQPDKCMMSLVVN